MDRRSKSVRADAVLAGVTGGFESSRIAGSITDGRCEAGIRPSNDSTSTCTEYGDCSRDRTRCIGSEASVSCLLGQGSSCLRTSSPSSVALHALTMAAMAASAQLTRTPTTVSSGCSFGVGSHSTRVTSEFVGGDGSTFARPTALDETDRDELDEASARWGAFFWTAAVDEEPDEGVLDGIGGAEGRGSCG